MFPSKLLKKNKSSSSTATGTTDAIDKSVLENEKSTKSFRLGLGSFMHKKIIPQAKGENNNKLVVKMTPTSHASGGGGGSAAPYSSTGSESIDSSMVYSLQNDLANEKQQAIQLREECLKLKDALESEKNATASLRNTLASIQSDDAISGLVTEISQMSEMYCASQSQIEHLKATVDELTKQKEAALLSNNNNQNQNAAKQRLEEDAEMQGLLDKIQELTIENSKLKNANHNNNDNGRAQQQQQQQQEVEELKKTNEALTLQNAQLMNDMKYMQSKLINEVEKNKLLIADYATLQGKIGVLQHHKKNSDFDFEAEKKIRLEQKEHSIAIAKKLLKERKISKKEFDRVIKAAEEAASLWGAQ